MKPYFPVTAVMETSFLVLAVTETTAKLRVLNREWFESAVVHYQLNTVFANVAMRFTSLFNFRHRIQI